MSNCGDLVVISMLDHDTDQVAAFEELIGSHGGLGGPQTEPLILYPYEWQLEKEPLVGAPAGLPPADGLAGQVDGDGQSAHKRSCRRPDAREDTGEGTQRGRGRRVIKAQATFLGHSTVLVEMGGARILTDPVLFDRVTILRRTVSPLPPELYERVDLVLISHAHLDHLDLPSLVLLGTDTPLAVPRGAGRLLRRTGFRNVTELASAEQTISARCASRRRRRRIPAFGLPLARTPTRWAT